MACNEWDMNAGMSGDLGMGFTLTLKNVTTDTVNISVKNPRNGSIRVEEGGEYEGVPYQTTVHNCSPAESGSNTEIAVLLGGETYTFANGCTLIYEYMVSDGAVHYVASNLPFGHIVAMIDSDLNTGVAVFSMSEPASKLPWIIAGVGVAGVALAYVAGRKPEYYRTAYEYGRKGVGYAGERLTKSGKRF